MKKLLAVGGKLLKVLLALILLIAVIVLLSIPLSRFNSPNLEIDDLPGNTLLLENVQLVDIDNNRIVSEQSVFIEDGKIVEIGDAKTLIQ